MPRSRINKIAKEPVSLDAPVEFDPDEEKELAEYLEIVGPDGVKRKLTHPRKSKLLEKLKKDSME